MSDIDACHQAPATLQQKALLFTCSPFDGLRGELGRLSVTVRIACTRTQRNRHSVFNLFSCVNCKTLAERAPPCVGFVGETRVRVCMCVGDVFILYKHTHTLGTLFRQT